ncbi:MAG TPA: amino acid adenylation domain-containing protein [Sphingomonas sp.]
MSEPAENPDFRRQLLAKVMSGEVGAAALRPRPAPIPPRNPARAVGLTAEQSQLWLHAQMAPETPLYNESITIHRTGAYDHRALEQALTEIVRRHAIWRTSFIEVDGELRQQVVPDLTIAVPLADLGHLPPAERDPEAVRLATRDARAAIPLNRAPLFRARVVRFSETEHRLYLTLHHIIFDGVSIYRTLMPELAALVAAFERGQPSPLAEPALQYADYAAWQAEQADTARIRAQIDHWRATLAEPLPRLDLAGDRPRPAIATHAGSMETFALPAALIDALRRLALSEGATLYMVLLAAYKAMLFRYTGDTDIIIGGVTDTRRRPELQSLMGYFLNTLALRSRPRGDLPFRTYLEQVKTAVIDALGAVDVPFDRIVRELDIKRGTGTHPLFNTLFSIEPPVDPFAEGWDLTQMDVTVGAAKYDIYLELDERPDGMAGRVLYSTELFDHATIARMIDHWRRLLEGIAADPDAELAMLPMLAESEQALVDGWNATARPLAHQSVVPWFAERAREMPDAIAVEMGDTGWSYADLARRSDTIAARIAEAGVGAGDLVGLALDRSPWMIAAMLGIAKAGAAYLPLDPGFPPSRLALIARDARPALLLVEAGTRDALPAGVAPLLVLSPDWPDAAFEPEPVAGEDLVYVLYTSGSTGMPKGVEIPHAALVNLLAAMRDRPGFARGETLLAITTLSFDIAELELWLPLVSGGRIILAPREAAMDMAALIQLIETAKPYVLQATPATWRGLIESGWRGAAGLRALCGGEALPRALADQLLPRVGRLWNMYGPTETTIWSTVAEIMPGQGGVPIGRPIDNSAVRILDDDGNDRPIGAIGELLIGGRGLARGYRGRPDLTAERFVEYRGTRLYRTGDLGRWRADGILECLGRTDNEEKIRGFRVAIEEVEGALARLPGVAGAAVRAWPDASGERALTGYIVGTGEIGAWREQLAAILPDYMIPTRFVRMDALPLTPNGKVDRKALAEPGAQVGRRSDPPASPEEERLAAIWRPVLKVEAVFRDDDFFDLGGHSLLVARLLRRIEAEYGIRVPMAALFRAPKLRDMAELIESGRQIDAPAVVPIQPHGTKPAILWLDGGSTFLPVVERLGHDQPFFGIAVDTILEAAGGCPKRFEVAASLVVAAIRAAQPRGPYRIGGWCTSGILAYAVADELTRQGETVSLLMLAHAFHPVKSRQISEVRLFVSKFRFHVARSAAQPKGERWRYFRERLRGLSDAAALRGGREAILQPKLRTALDRAALGYTPPVYAGDVLLLQPAEHPDVLDFIDDWKAHIAGDVTAHIVPGGHRSMLEPPHVDVFAGLLREALDKRG